MQRLHDCILAETNRTLKGALAYLQEEENLTLAANNARLEQRIAELEAALKGRATAGTSQLGTVTAAENAAAGVDSASMGAGAAAGQVQAQHKVSEQAEQALQQAAAARRLSGAYMVRNSCRSPH